ncbi:MAG TPA: SDR family oxidoreductase [Thermoleophilaceae bacterium]|nr:SDR family oxidoreductase [Thermoleophilaceae bacterium]
MRALVTGGGGFIGSNIVERLLERGDDVRVLDNFSTGKRENLAPFVDDVELVEGDLRSYERVHNAVKDCEVVFHQGAMPSVPRSVQDPITSSDINVGGTLNVLLAARDADARRVVFASSSSIYGDLPGLPRVETMPVGPAAPYAVSKLAAEHYCHVATKVYGLTTVSLRYFNIFGKRQDPLSQYSAVIPKFIAALREGRSPTIHGDGEQSRDFTHIDNAVAANLLAAEAPDAGGKCFNVATGESQSLNDLVRQLNELMGTDIPAEHGPQRPGDVAHSLADISRAREVLGYEPAVSFQEGLRMTIESFDEGHKAAGLAR